ncbi:MAG: aminopeptidase [Planctomycetota bacterium]|nr:aminopeptidase [Planctomycetota bacterium]
MRTTDQVRIVSPGTDLSFSIKDIPVIPCSGDRNIPDRECFTAPVRNSVNGKIKYNTKARYQGTIYDGLVRCRARVAVSPTCIGIDPKSL